MPAELIHYFTARNPTELARDALDLAITYFVFYRIALVMRGTRAVQVVAGLGLVLVLYAAAEVLQLRTVLMLLNAVLSSALLIAVVVFQADIRRGLMRFGAQARFGGRKTLQSQVLDDVVEAATTLARHRTGALMAFEQDANLDEFVGTHTGQSLNAAVSPDLLVSLFVPEAMNKLHDGAVIIRDLRIAKAGVFFPLPQQRVADASFGSRHRAALGITEETDAVVVVVSEERGSISLCFNGNIIANLNGPGLRSALDGIFQPKRLTRQVRPSAWWRPWGASAQPPPSERRMSRPVHNPPVPEPVSERRRLEAEPPTGEPPPLRKKKSDAGVAVPTPSGRLESIEAAPSSGASAPSVIDVLQLASPIETSPVEPPASIRLPKVESRLTASPQLASREPEEREPA